MTDYSQDPVLSAASVAIMEAINTHPVDDTFWSISLPQKVRPKQEKPLDDKWKDPLCDHLMTYICDAVSKNTLSTLWQEASTLNTLTLRMQFLRAGCRAALIAGGRGDEVISQETLEAQSRSGMNRDDAQIQNKVRALQQAVADNQVFKSK